MAYAVAGAMALLALA
jgi:hypothetical protein